MLPASRCVVLVPVASAIDPDCEDGLRELERRGYAVWRVRGYAAIDAARNQMASDALAQGFDELMWIDADGIFDPDDVDKLRRHNLPLVCGIYPKKACRQFACAFLPETRQLLFGVRGGTMELLYCGFGFTLTHRSLYESIHEQLGLPRCNQRFQAPLVPFFTPLIAGEEEEEEQRDEPEPDSRWRSRTKPSRDRTGAVCPASSPLPYGCGSDSFGRAHECSAGTDLKKRTAGGAFLPAVYHASRIA